MSLTQLTITATTLAIILIVETLHHLSNKSESKRLNLMRANAEKKRNKNPTTPPKKGT